MLTTESDVPGIIDALAWAGFAVRGSHSLAGYGDKHTLVFKFLSFVTCDMKLKVLQTNSAQSSVVNTEESRHNHNKKTNRFCYSMCHCP